MMDLDKVLLTFYTVFLALLLTSGLVHAQWDVETDDIDSVEQYQPIERRDWGIAGYEPRYDWSETFRNNDNTLMNLLKRADEPYVSDSYRRFPRIKQIIPFYSYGDALRGYRSRLSFGGRRRNPYTYNPWSRKSYLTGRRVQTPIYAGY